jgi:hypothetical protein
LLKIAPLCVFRRAAILRNRKAASLFEHRAAPILWPQRDFEWYLPRFLKKKLTVTQPAISQPLQKLAVTSRYNIKSRRALHFGVPRFSSNRPIKPAFFTILPIPIFLLLLCQNFPRNLTTEFFHYHHLNHFLNIIKPQIHHPFINLNLHNSPIFQNSTNFPFTIFLSLTNGLQPKKHSLKESHQPQTIHKQIQTSSYRIRTTRKRHSFHQ